jgi:hypothetical protein
VVPILGLLVLSCIAFGFVWTRREQTGGRGVPWFIAWAVAGFLLIFSGISFGAGLFVLPLAAVALIWVIRRAPHLPEASGFVVGVGLVLLTVAVINRGNTPCVGGATSVVAQPGTASSCGGLDPHPWLVGGILATAAGLIAYCAYRFTISNNARRENTPDVHAR